MLETNQLFNVELRGTDSSSGMLSVAEDRLSKLNKQHLTVQFSSLDYPLNSNMYDIITMSLVLPYASDKAEMLRDRFNELKPKGFLISSHWPHPSQVPFLSVIKSVNSVMATGEKIDISQLESDASFSCWQEETIRQLFMAEGFTVENWIPLNLPMSFPNIRALLSFCGVCPWFNNKILYHKAEEETKRILREDYGLQLNSNGSLQLSNTVTVVVASKASSISK
jgi:SAM-dependent methyltransferase